MKLGADQLLRLIVPFLILGGCTGIDKLRVLYSWKALDFAFPSEYAKEAAIREGRFIPGGPVPIDVDFYHRERSEVISCGTDDPPSGPFPAYVRAWKWLVGLLQVQLQALTPCEKGLAKQGSVVFVSIPRFQNGVPVTLGYVTDNVSADGNPLIAPYPNWDWNRLGNCDAITSVYRMQVDSCDRLWVLDTGKLGDRQICRPQLLSFSLRTNKVLSQYKFPKEQFKDDSLFVTLAVDVRNDGLGEACHDTYVYIADVLGFSLIVYDHRNSHSWKIGNKLFYPYPPHGTYHIDGHTFDLMDGIIGLALGPVSNNDRILYFHSLASRVESWVPTSVIRNHSLFQDDPDAEPRSFTPFAMERSSQSVAQAMDDNGVLFFGLLSDLAIGCWNSITHPEYGGTNIDIVVVNPETLQFPSGMKIIQSKNGHKELWMLTSSFQKYMTGSLYPNETNFRIQAGYMDELIRGTKCSGSHRQHSNRGYGSLQFAK